jgi:hypothetical protein
MDNDVYKVSQCVQQGQENHILDNHLWCDTEESKHFHTSFQD